MATIAHDIWTIHDSVSLQDPSGKHVKNIINLLSQMTPVYKDGKYTVASHGDYHKNTYTVGRSTPGRSAANQGYDQAVSTYAADRDTIGNISSLVTTDKRTVGPYQSLAQIRAQRVKDAIEEIAKQFETDFFYGDISDDPLEFNGLATRYNALPNSSSALSNLVVDAGGVSGDLTSIYLVTWGDSQCNLIHRPDQPAGVMREDKGDQRVLDSNSKPYYAAEEVLNLSCGLTLGDYTFSGRVANIDVGFAQAGDVDIYKYLQELVFERTKGHYNDDLNDANPQATGRQVLYMNRKIFSALVTLGRNAGTSDQYVRLTPKEIQGRTYESYMNIPIKVTDGIVNTESAVS